MSDKTDVKREIMVSLDKSVKLYVTYKRDVDGMTYKRAFFAKKNDKDISRIVNEVFKMDIPLNSPMQVIQPNWAGTDKSVILVDYVPFHSIWTNKDHVRKA